MVVVEDHGAAAPDVHLCPVVDGPGLKGDLAAHFLRGGRAVGLGGLDIAPVDPGVRIGAALDGFDLAGMEQRVQSYGQGGADGRGCEEAEEEESSYG